MCPLTGVGTERTRTPHVCHAGSCALVYLTPLCAHYPSLTTLLFSNMHPLGRTGMAWTRENETKIGRSNAPPPGYLMSGGRGGFRADNLITEHCVSKSCSGRRRQRSLKSEGTGIYFRVSVGDSSSVLRNVLPAWRITSMAVLAKRDSPSFAGLSFQ